MFQQPISYGTLNKRASNARVCLCRATVDSNNVVVANSAVEKGSESRRQASSWKERLRDMCHGEEDRITWGVVPQGFELRIIRKSFFNCESCKTTP